MAELKEKHKILVMALLLAGSVILLYYFHKIIEIDVVFSHLFYIPIILATLWWKRKGLIVPIFLAIMLNLSILFFRTDVILENQIRSVMFIVIGLLVAELSKKIAMGEKYLRKSHEELRESKEELDLIFQIAADSMCVIDTDHNVIKVNKTFIRMVDIAEDEIIGKKCYDILSNVICHSEDCPLEKIKKGEQFVECEVVIKRSDDKHIPAILNASRFDRNGKFVGIVEDLKDITDRKLAEQEIKNLHRYNRGLIEASLDPLMTFDQNGIIQDVNEATIRAIGRTRKELIGTPFANHFTDPEKAHKGAMLVFETGEVRDYELVMLAKDGTETIVSYNASVYKDQMEQVIGAFASTHDISYHKKSEEKIKKLNMDLKQYSAELETINEELEAFNYSVSHDLRAPLRSIDGFSMALLEDYVDKLDAQGKDYLHRVRAASQNMAQLIDDLLNLSRVTRSEMRHDSVNLSALTQSIAAELKKMEPERQVEFVIAEGAIVTGDKRLLRIVMENLLENAWKFTANNPKSRIEFGITQFEDKPAYFIRDDGVGFDMAYADKLFGAFQRLHSANEFAGTGIGLATVQRIIHRHGGQVWAEGAVEQGATFYFTL